MKPPGDGLLKGQMFSRVEPAEDLQKLPTHS